LRQICLHPRISPASPDNLTDPDGNHNKRGDVMNFNDASTDVPVGKKTTDRKSNESGEDILDNSVTTLDNELMDAAQKGQERMIKNENTNSSNTIFSK
jgi:hypothetical protein